VSFLFTVMTLVVVLGVLIFIHELGHFLAAKWAGIRVHRFALGVGTPIPGLSFRRGDTEYSICWLPIGGYVKMASREEVIGSSALEGDIPEGEGIRPVEPGEYFESKSLGARMVVILAGVSMNVVFAFLAYTGLAAKNGEQIDPVTTIGGVAVDSLPPGAEALATLQAGDRIVSINGRTVTSWNAVTEGILSEASDSVVIQLADGRHVVLQIHHTALADRYGAALALDPYHVPLVQAVQPGRAGDRAGLLPGDTVVAVAGVPVTRWGALVTEIRGSAGRPLVLEVGRPGGRVRISVVPDSVPEGNLIVGKVGVVFQAAISFESRPYSFAEAVNVGFQATLSSSTQIIRTVQGLLSARISSRELGGPILIGQMAAQSARIGFDAFLAFMALISVNLAVLNLLPIPILDGGQFFFLLAEGVARRPLSLAVRERLTQVGFFLLLLIMVLAFSNDIRRLLGW